MRCRSIRVRAVTPGFKPVLAIFSIFSTLACLAILCATPASALADKLGKKREVRPARLDFAREKPASGQRGVTLSVAFPRGEPRLERTFDVMACARASIASDTAADGRAALLAKELTLNAVMPEHAHGMMVVPERIAAREPKGAAGRPRCVVWKGLRFHMSGWWRVDLLASGGERTSFDFDLP
jgi:hypothetical protein